MHSVNPKKTTIGKGVYVASSLMIAPTYQRKQNFMNSM
jgi:hypothetical protein